MRSIWTCSSCAASLLFALLSGHASASHLAREWKDVHRIPKARVTAHPVRRDEGSCPAEYTSCAADLGGDCCPSRYACATDSCYATTAGPTTACEREGHYACAPINGLPGCCSVGFICADNGGCDPPVGVTYTDIGCPSDYYLCPASVGIGCCMTGFACGADRCYPTEPVTTTVLQTITTTSGTVTVTRTRPTKAVVTPTIPTESSGDTDGVAKFIPTSVPKVPATSPSSEPSGGLSGGAVGGIIAGVVVLLIVVVLAAFLIIRRLKRVEDIMESKRGSSSGKKTRSQTQAQMEQYGRQLHSDVDDMSIDPLMVAPSITTNNNSISGTPQPGVAARGRSDSAGFTTPSPNMFPNYTDDRSRHASPDSNAGYFDTHYANPAAAAFQQQPMQPARIRGDTESSVGSNAQHRSYAYTHWRQQSNASELSADGSENGAGAAGVGSPLMGAVSGSGGAAVAASSPPFLPNGGGVFSELDGSVPFAELPSGSDRGPGPVVGASGVRSRSSSAASARGHVRRRSDGVPGHDPGAATGVSAAPGSGLEPLDETAEMHGYYGRSNQQAGQTAAGLNSQWNASGGYHHHPEAPQEPPAGRGS
ncbi:hypothetical protein P885DRAFT_35982 [Corynascus similis CBS 632.67]